LVADLGTWLIGLVVRAHLDFAIRQNDQPSALWTHSKLVQLPEVLNLKMRHGAAAT
jgi:hypothetical protein